MQAYALYLVKMDYNYKLVAERKINDSSGIYSWKAGFAGENFP